jgi:hypothetical protein
MERIHAAVLCATLPYSSKTLLDTRALISQVATAIEAMSKERTPEQLMALGNEMLTTPKKPFKLSLNYFIPTNNIEVTADCFKEAGDKFKLAKQCSSPT